MSDKDIDREWLTLRVCDGDALVDTVRDSVTETSSDFEGVSTFDLVRGVPESDSVSDWD